MAEHESDPVARGRWLTFVVVGAGPTGVELAGQLAELSRRSLRRNFRYSDPADARVLLLDAGPTILPAFPQALRERAMRDLRAIGIEIHVGTAVTKVDERGLEPNSAVPALRRIEAATKGEGPATGLSSKNSPLGPTSQIVPFRMRNHHWLSGGTSSIVGGRVSHARRTSQHVAALWELVRADERGAAVTYFMCDVVGMPKIIGFLFRFFPMWPKLKAVAHTLPYDLTIMADTAILDGAAKQVKVPTLVAGGAKSPGSLKAAVERVHAAIPGSQLRWLEGQTHNLAAEPAAAMAKEFFLGR